nr:hypothetical protein [Pseudopedobacter sp.]
MTESIKQKPNWLIALGVPSLIFFCAFLISFTTKFKAHEVILSNAMLVDILILAPLIYFLAIRKSRVSNLTVIRIFLIGLMVACLILNSQTNPFLHVLKVWVSPLIELGVIFFIVSKFYIANKKAKVNHPQLDFLTHCRAVMLEVIGNEKFSNIISSEIATFYYTFLGQKDKGIDYKTKFTAYKESGVLAVIWAFMMIILVETIGLHFLLILWSKTFAWILSGLSLYTVIQLFAHFRALKARPITIHTDALEIHHGLSGDAYISFKNIESFEVTKKLPLNRNVVSLMLIKKLEEHNMVVYLKKPIEVNKLLGMKKTTDTVVFCVDQVEDFTKALKLKMKNNAEF